MKFQYIGCGAHDAPREIRAYGHDFVLKGEPVEVLDPHAIKKLMGCRTFVHEPVLAAPVAGEAAEEVEQEDVVEAAEGDDVPEVVVPAKAEKPKGSRKKEKGR